MLVSVYFHMSCWCSLVPKGSLTCFKRDSRPPFPVSTPLISRLQTNEGWIKEEEVDGEGEKDFLPVLRACVKSRTCPQRSLTGRRSLALPTAVLFSHTVIGRGAPSIAFTLTRGPAPCPSPRNPIGYCMRSCAAIGCTAWLSRLRGFIHHFATVV